MFKKLMSADILDVMPDVEAAARRGGHQFAYILSITVFAFFVIFLLWANWATLDEVTRGDGQVIPSSRVQVIQNLEGGIIAEVLVHEGQIVEANDILLRLDNATAQSNYRDIRSQHLAGLAGIARLEAMLRDAEPVYPKELIEQAPDILEDQKRIHAARKGQIAAQLGALESQVTQRRQEIAEMKSRQTQLSQSLAIAQEQHNLAKPMADQGIYPRVEFLTLERELSSLKGDLNTIKLSLTRANSALQESEQRVAEQVSAAKSEMSSELTKLRQETQSLAEAITAGRDRVSRTEVRSPVRGTVKQIKQTTIGGVVRPGDDMMEIVPLDDRLLIEARIRPADIAFLHPGQPAMVKITAYDFGIYGGLKAKLEEISADTLRNDKGESFYRIRLRTDKNTLMHRGQPLPIIPGMTASVDILTGEKTVMDYLLKPILKAKERALNER
jgi:adhesin transport system membrane fusion protein